MIKFKQFEKYPTRNGGTALILATNQGDYKSMVVARYGPDGRFDGATTYRPDGRAGNPALSGFDILPPEPETREVWVVVEDKGSGLALRNVYATADEAHRSICGAAGAYVSGCHRITLRAEFEGYE